MRRKSLRKSCPPTSHDGPRSRAPAISRSSNSLSRRNQSGNSGADDGNDDIEDQSAKPGVERVGGPAEIERRQRLQPVTPRRVCPPRDSRGPAEQQPFGAEPAREQTEHQGRERLQDPQTAEQLQIERILRRQEDREG